MDNKEETNKKENILIRFKNSLHLDKLKFNTIELIVILIIGLLLGVFLGELIFGGKSNTNKVNKTADEINDVYNTLLNEYYGELTEEDLKEAAIKAMMETLGDKNSVYMDDTESDAFVERLKGTYIGIGLEVQSTKDYPIIANIFENTPAEKAGLEKGDLIIKVDGEDVKGKALNDVTGLIKGVLNKKTKLVIKRDDKEINKTIVTGEIDIPSVTSKIIEKDNKKIGYLYLSLFALNTDEQFSKKLKELEASNIDGLIIDVRSNSGGYLDTCSNILSSLLTKEQVMYQIKTKKETTKYFGSAKENKSYKIVVLTDALSASASEVLSAALNEELKAPLIGNKTYGKGTVQKTLELSDGSMIKYTAETWLTSKGNSINEAGIEPTIEVSLNKEYFTSGLDKDDNQLQKAISEVLSK